MQSEALTDRLAGEDRVLAWFRDTTITPDQANRALVGVGSSPLTQATKAADLLKRPRVDALALIEAAGGLPGLEDAPQTLAAVEVELKYSGYVARERERAGRLRDQANFLLANDLDYMTFTTLSHEAREKLTRVRPETLAQAWGVTRRSTEPHSAGSSWPTCCGAPLTF